MNRLLLNRLLCFALGHAELDLIAGRIFPAGLCRRCGRRIAVKP